MTGGQEGNGGLPANAVCPACGQESDHDWLFCPTCGGVLRIACRACKHPNPATARFCVLCGASVTGPTSSAAPQARMCESCLQPNALNAESCTNCGLAFDQSVPQTLSPVQSLEQAETAQSPAENEGLSPEEIDASRPSAVIPVSQTPPMMSIRPCPRCKYRNDATSTFCVNCGLPFEGEPPLARVDEATMGPNGTPYQGFWIRLVAHAIDVVILFIALLAVAGLLDAYLSEDASEGVLFAGYAISLSISLLYEVIFVGSLGATLGKYIVGIKIVRYDGRRVGYGRALGRHLSTYLSSLFLCIGYLMIAARPDKRGLHDIIAGTVIVKKR